MSDILVEPFEVARLVDQYADDQHLAASKYTNSEPLDESGIYTLHNVAARIYALGFKEGQQVQNWRDSAERSRKQDAERRAAAGDEL